MLKNFVSRYKKVVSFDNDNEFQAVKYLISTMLIGIILLIYSITGINILGTALFRSHNTNPRIGTVWLGGITSDTREKCYGPNLIVTQGSGISTIKDSQVCNG